MRRIKGLVRAFNQVRSQLQAGIPSDQAEAFRRRVTTTVDQVEAICRQHGTTPDQLPGPSRSSYRFLKDLDLDRLPLAEPGAPAPAPSWFRLKNLLTLEQDFAHRIWERLPVLLESPSAAGHLNREIEGQASVIERMCSVHSVAPSDLDVPSRRVYCWLKFLSGEDNLALHLGALRRASGALAEGERPPDRPLRVHLIHMQALWRSQQHQDLLLKVSEGFLNAPENVWRALLLSATSGRDRANDGVVREFAASEDFSEVLAEMDAFAQSMADSTRGRVHDLDESFERVNLAYFGGAMPRPRLVWNRMLTGTKFGHYRSDRDTVMVSVSLDDPSVPAQLVDFIMYHELLHKHHGYTTVGDRRFVHTPAFRADERAFASYDEARRRLDALALRHRAPG